MCERPQMGCGDCCAPAGTCAGVPNDCTVRPDPNKNCSCNKQQSCYQQPPREKSYKPISNYCRPTEPMDCNTVYKRSFYPVEPCALKRLPPIIPSNNLINITNCKLDTNTIQKLSYQGHCGISPPKPIIQQSNNLGNSGPMQTITTQKHDYVAKPVSKREPILHCGNIDKTCAPLEKLTINRLSYMPFDICKNPPPKPIVHLTNCQRPTAPAECLTVQKLSYMPVGILPKEPLPWARKVHLIPPPYPSEQGTTYGLSYLPNCKIGRAKPILPMDGAKLFGSDIPQPCTVYNLSYMCNKGNRPQPILPQQNLLPSTGPMEKCTVYKLSYQPNCVPNRVQPILPVNNYSKSADPMARITTQKHDFVPKPYSKPLPITQITHIPRACAPLETHTINRLSFMPVDINKFRPPQPYIPQENQHKALGPISNCTTYKLSYMPNCPTPKETLPWAQRSSYEKPSMPMETCTIQKLSYMPPGRFTNCGCSCECKADLNFPRAGICN